MMRHVRFVALVIPLVGGCGGNSVESVTAPTPVAPAQRVQEPATPPEPSSGPTHLDRYRASSMESAVVSQVTGDDFLCDPGWSHYCQGFLVQAPTNARVDNSDVGDDPRSVPARFRRVRPGDRSRVLLGR